MRWRIGDGERNRGRTEEVLSGGFHTAVMSTGHEWMADKWQNGILRTGGIFRWLWRSKGSDDLTAMETVVGSSGQPEDDRNCGAMTAGGKEEW